MQQWLLNGILMMSCHNVILVKTWISSGKSGSSGFQNDAVPLHTLKVSRMHNALLKGLRCLFLNTLLIRTVILRVLHSYVRACVIVFQ